MGGSPFLKCTVLKELKSAMIDHNLVDILRARNPNLRQFTWRRSNPIKLRRLDFFLISDDMRYDATVKNLLLNKVITLSSLFVTSLYHMNSLE